MPKPNRRLAWIVLAVWAALGTVAGIEAGDAATHLTGQGGTSVHAEADVAGSMLQRAFPRPLSDVFAVTVQSPEPVTAPRPAAALDSLAVTLRRMPGARAVVTPQADTGGSRIPLVSRDARRVRRPGAAGAGDHGSGRPLELVAGPEASPGGGCRCRSGGASGGGVAAGA